MLSDQVKDRNELEMEMMKKSHRDLGDRTERNKNGGKVMPEKRLRNLWCRE